jgi:type III secretion protein C
MHPSNVSGADGRRHPVAASLAAALVALSSCAGAAAAEAPIAVRGRLEVSERSAARFVYKAEGKRLTELLQDFAASQGIPAITADGVEGVVHANFDTTPRQFLDAVSKTFGLIWYHDGTALYFYPAKSIQSRIFRLKGYSQPQLQDLMRSLKLGDQRYPLKFDNLQKTLLVYGPPRHVELVASAIDALDIGATEGNERVVRVVPLRFASANDRKLGDHTIPGVASILRSLYAGSGPLVGGPGDAGRGARVAGGKLKALQSLAPGKFMPELQLKPAPGEPNGSATQPPSRGVQSPVDQIDDTPAFEADEGTNSVIVHGRGSRMTEYIELIKRLDVQPELVELEATIIDVSTDSVESLGVDWAVRGTRSSVGVTGPNVSRNELINGVPVPDVFNVTTLVANAGRELIARVHALEGQGKARIIAKPKVLGVANRPASMQSTRQVMVRVAGNLEANLFQLEAGTRLQVTPQVIARKDGTQLKMSLFIQDGNLEARQVDGVPVIKNSEIRTEAHVRDGESLLIGGITIDSDASELNIVPIVSELPLVGHLFKWRTKNASRSERLFLITPRLLPSVPDAQPSGTSLQVSTAPAPQAASSAPGEDTPNNLEIRALFAQDELAAKKKAQPPERTVRQR